jgi:hypothetical protein
MTLDKTCSLFFGVKIDSKLRDALYNAKPGDRHYFEDENPDFLRICEVGESEQWIGKVVKGGINVTEVEDIQRNVLSILRRIAAGTRIAPSSVKIFVLQTAPAPVKDDDRSPNRGPYIANY